MAHFINKKKARRFIAVSLFLLLLTAVLCGTVYAVSLDNSAFSPIAAKAPQQVGSGSYSITVNTHYDDAVSAQTQTVEIYDDTTVAAAATGTNAVSYSMPSANTSPTLNVKSDSSVSVTSVVVRNSGGTDITSDAFGSEGAYAYFIESCRTSLFGYFELKNITDDITVDVYYGEPVTSLGDGYYSVTVVTKGDVGGYQKVFANDTRAHQAVAFSNVSYSNYQEASSYSNALDTAYGSGSGYSSFTYSSDYTVYGQKSNMDISDGGQLTRYCYYNSNIYFDTTNYAYISDIKAYDNLTGDLVDLDFSSILGKKIAYDRVFTYNAGSGINKKSVTFVVTYRELPTKIVYTKLNYKESAYDRTLGITCPDQTDNHIFQSSTSTGVTFLPLSNSTNPLQKTSQYNQAAFVDADKIRIRLNDTEAGNNSVDFSNIKVYRLNVSSATAPDDITDSVTITSTGRTAWNDDCYVEISGLQSITDNIYVSLNFRFYNSTIRLKTSGAHTDSLLVNTVDDMGRIGTGRSDSAMADNYTLNADTAYADLYMYCAAQYKLRSSGTQKLARATLYYYNSEAAIWVTDEFTAEEDGTVIVTVPQTIYYKLSDNYNYLKAYFEPLNTQKAQVYIAQNDSTASFSQGDMQFLNVTTVDASNAPVNAMFRETSNGIKTFSTMDFNQTSDAVTNNYAYQIVSGTKVNVKYLLDPADSGSNYSSLDQTAKDFINSRIEFSGIKVYKMSGSTVGDELPVTESNGIYSFTMPANYNVRIVPVFHDHIHTVAVIANDKNQNGKNYRIDKSTRGTATLTGDSNSYFTCYGWGTSPFYNGYQSASYLTHNWAYNRSATLDGTSFTLKVTPKTQNGVQTYKVAGVKAYLYPNSSYLSPNRNNIYTYDIGETVDWIKTDDNGNITNRDLSDVITVGELSEPEEDGSRSCNITLPYDMDANGSLGHIILYVEFEENADIFSEFKYEPVIPSGTSAAKPNTVLNGGIKDVTGDYTATNGADIQVEYYDTDKEEADRKMLSMTIGSSANSSANCAFYYTNLVYTVSSYDGTATYGSFRIFKDQIIDLDTGTMRDYVDLDNAVFTVNSGACLSTSSVQLNIKVPKTGGLKITCSPQETYIPVKIKQYIIDEDGTVSDATQEYSATVKKFVSSSVTSSDDYVTDKYFTKTYTEDYYSVLSDPTENFTDTFTVTGGEAAVHNMALYNSGSQGYYIKPDVPEGYVLAGFTAVAYNRAGEAYPSTWGSRSYSDSFNYNNVPTSVTHHADGYLFDMYTNGNSRSSRQEVSLYYTRPSKLTVLQHLPGVLDNNNTVANISISNYNGTLQNDAVTPFIDITAQYPQINTYSQYDNRNNRTNYYEENSYWEKELLVNIGTVTRITVQPSATRNIAKVEVYKMVNGERQDLAYTVISGSGSVGENTVYQLDNPVAFNEDIHFDVTYGNEQTLTVKAMMYNDSNGITANDVTETKATVTVTGVKQDESGTDRDKPFHRSGSTSYFGTFDTSTEDTVLTFSNVDLTIDTAFSDTSDYVVAYVALQEIHGSGRTNVTGLTAKKITDIEGNEIGRDYSHCTVSGLTPGTNMEIVVYLMKTARMRVAVHTYDLSGELHDGVPNRQDGTGDVTGAYINFKGKSGVNPLPFITKETEGNYNTGDFRLTYGQNSSRDVQVLQGTNLEVFSMLPESGDFVVKKITGTGFSTGVGSVKIEQDESGARFLATTITTNGTIYPNRPGGYSIDIYIAPAKSIVTQTRTYTGIDPDTGEAKYTKPNGSVHVYADDAESDVITFTKMYPTKESFNTNDYIASTDYNSTEPIYTTKTKCQAGSKLHFTVKPNANFMIKSVEAHQGSANGAVIKLRRSKPTADGTVTYTLMNGSDRYTMPELEDVYLDVVFETKTTGTVTIDYQYTDDYNTWNPYFGDKGTGTVSGSNSNSAYADVYKLTKGSTGESANAFDLNLDSDATDTYSVVTGSTVTVRTENLNDGWYMPVEAYVTDSAGARVTLGSSTVNSDSISSLSAVVNTGDALTFHVRFVPVARYSFLTIDNNTYDGTPEGVQITDKTFLHRSTITAANDQSILNGTPIHSYNNGITWSASSNNDGRIAKGSTVNNLNVNYSSLVYPGYITHVRVYEFDKTANTEDITQGALIADVTDQYEYPNYSGAFTSNTVYSHPASYDYLLNVDVEDQKQYLFYVELDLIDIYVSCNSGDVNTYLVRADNKDFNLSYSSTYDFKTPLTFGFAADYDCKLSQGFENVQGSVYFVLESNSPKEDLELISATYKDYKDKDKLSILDTMTNAENYRQVVTQSGAKRYYYIYEITPTDNPSYPIDNSMEFKLIFRRISTSGTETTTTQEDRTASVSVTQNDRVSYSEYTVSRLDTAVVSHADGTPLKIVNDSASYNSVTVPNNGNTTVQMVSEKGKTLRFDLTPREGYNVEKIVINDSSVTTLYPKNAVPAGSDWYEYTIKSNKVTVNIYYTQPTLRITATNKADKPNAAVDVIDGESVIHVLKDTDYTKDTLVTKGQQKIVKIYPSTYDTEESGTPVTKKYTVDYISVGDAYDNELTIYDSSKANPNVSSAYDVEQDEDGNYTLTLSNIEKDTYIFIQMMGETRVRTSAIEVRHHIMDATTFEYVDCDANNPGGIVTTYGTLGDNTAPLTDSNGASCASFVLNKDESSVSGAALSGTALEFGVTEIPHNFNVRVEGKYGSGSSVYQATRNNNGRYQFSFNAPDSGVLYVDVYYSLNLTEYTLNYRYNGRQGGNESAYVGDNLAEDAKVYSVKVKLTDSYIKDGKPIPSVLIENAPAVDDIYKNCKWTITENTSASVIYNTEDKEVDIIAQQSPKLYSVVFRYNNKTQTVQQVPINSLVKDASGSFITAPAKEGSSDFAYWSVQENGKETAKCFSRGFNLRVTGNYQVTAMYSSAANVLSISDPRYTRQQTSADGSKVDQLQVDFLLAFMEKNGLLLNSDLAAQKGYKSGVVVEYYTDDAYILNKEDKTGDTLTADDKTSVTLPAVNTGSITDLIESSGTSAENGSQKLLQYAVPNSYYNNKNRVDRVIKFENRHDLRHYVFRAYYYVSHTDEEGHTVTQLSDPVYFYLYDIGNADVNAEEG